MKTQTARVLTGIGSFILAVAVAYAVAVLLGHRELRKAYEALEARGRPMDPAQIVPPPVPDSDNAALVYQAVGLRLRAESAELYSELDTLAEQLLSETADARARRRFRELTRRPNVQEALADLRRGTRKPGCRFDLDYSKGAGLLLPHLGELRRLVNILSARARVHAAHGETEQAWEDVEAVLRLANATRKEPLLISQLVRVALCTRAVETLQVLVEVGSPEPSRLDSIAKEVQRFEDMAPLVSAMDGERLLLGEWAFGLASDARGETTSLLAGDPASELAKLSTFRPVFLRDHAAYLEIMLSYTRHASEPLSSGKARMEKEWRDEVPWYCVLTRMLVPAYSGVRSRYLSMVARARVARTGLDLLRHATTAEDYGEGFERIPRSDRLDPFTGESLRTRISPTAFVVYSVGENRIDNQGDPADDIVWKISR